MEEAVIEESLEFTFFKFFYALNALSKECLKIKKKFKLRSLLL